MAGGVLLANYGYGVRKCPFSRMAILWVQSLPDPP
jgi:hypothetical protein